MADENAPTADQDKTEPKATARSPRHDADDERRAASVDAAAVRPGDRATTPLPDEGDKPEYPHVEVRGGRWMVGRSGLPVPGTTLVIPAGQEVVIDETSPWTDEQLDRLVDGGSLLAPETTTDEDKPQA